MKIGDKIYCKKCHTIFKNGLPDYSHLSGKMYEIEYLEPDIIYVKSELTPPWEYCGYTYDELYNHFLTLKELRKLKLEKIKNENL